jgi:hypothetical protein
VHRITSGDPSRGSISLSCQAAPIKGAQVQVSRLPFARPFSLDSIFQLCHVERELVIDRHPLGSPSMQFLALSRGTRLSAGSGATDHAILPDEFLAASENGFLVGSNGGTGIPWKCEVAGGLARLHWMG